MGQREFLGDALLLGQRRTPARQIGRTGEIARQQNAQLALAQDIDEVALEFLRLVERTVIAVDIGIRGHGKQPHE